MQLHYITFWLGISNEMYLLPSPVSRKDQILSELLKVYCNASCYSYMQLLLLSNSHVLLLACFQLPCVGHLYLNGSDTFIAALGTAGVMQLTSRSRPVRVQHLM